MSFFSLFNFFLNFLADTFKWMMSFYPFADVPISLFYLILSISFVVFLFNFLPVRHISDDDSDDDDYI